MRKPRPLLAMALQGALWLTAPVLAANTDSLPPFHLQLGLEQSIRFATPVIAVQAHPERIVRAEIEGDRLLLKGLSPGRARLDLIPAEGGEPLVLRIQVEENAARVSGRQPPQLSREALEKAVSPRQDPSMATDVQSSPQERESVPSGVEPTPSVHFARRTVVDGQPGGLRTWMLDAPASEPVPEQRMRPATPSAMPRAADAVPGNSGFERIVRQASAASPSALPLFSAVNRALSLDPEVQAGASDVERALGEIRVAQANYWPSLDASVGPENITKNGELGYDFLLSQMIFDWGRASSAVAEATAKQRKQVQSLLLIRNDAALELIEICYDLQIARQQMRLLRVFTERMEALQQLTRQRTAGGYSDRAELGRVRQALGYMEEQRATLHSDLLEAESQYRILMNLPAEQFPALLEPEDLFRQLADESALERVISRAPAFMEASQELMLAQAQLDQAEASYKPRLMLEGSSRKYESSGEMTRDSGIALRFRMDTMQGLSAFDRAEMERQNLAAAQWRLDSARRKLQRQFRSQQASRVAQQQRQQALALQLGQVSTISDTYREQFIAGLRTIDDLISVEREGYELAIQQIQSINEQQRLIYRAAADLGLLLPLLSGNLEGSLAP